MKKRSLLATALLLSMGAGAMGCSDAAPTPLDVADDARAADLAPPAPDQRLRPDAWVSTIAPAEFDCRKKGAPVRRNTVALGCILDRACSKTLVTGHRGAGVSSIGNFVVGRFAPENTMAAIRAAIVLGADSVEIDVRLSKDGILVLMHDATVDRTTSGQGKVSAMTLAELRALAIKSARFAGDFSCERVPTFDEVLTLAKGRINIDVDVKSGAAVAQMARAIEQQQMLDQAFLSSGSFSTLDAARKAVPKVRLQARAKSAADLAGALAITPPPSIVEIGEASLAAATIAKIHRIGAKVFVNAFTYDIKGYATDDPRGYKALVDKQPDIIQTDRPDLLLTLLGRERRK